MLTIENWIECYSQFDTIFPRQFAFRMFKIFSLLKWKRVDKEELIVISWNLSNEHIAQIVPLFDFIVSARHFNIRIRSVWLCTTTSSLRLRNSCSFVFHFFLCCDSTFSVGAVVCRHHKSWMKCFFPVWRTQPTHKHTHTFWGDTRSHAVCVVLWPKDMRLYACVYFPFLRTVWKRYMLAGMGEREKIRKGAQQHTQSTQNDKDRQIDRIRWMKKERTTWIYVKMKMDVGFSFSL